MTQRTELNSTFLYNPAGTLVKPRALGRLVRLTLGVLCILVAWDAAFASSPTDTSSMSWWLMVCLSLLLINYVVNIGFGLSVGYLPLFASLFILLTAGITSVVVSDSLLGYPLWIATSVWLVYLFGHLGISFLLAAILRTPGCEMRAIPHLIGIASDREVAEHYCPAFIDNIDKWEEQRSRGIEPRNRADDNDVRSKDLLGSAGSMLLIYGVPFAAIQAAGIFGSYRIATLVPAAAFLFIAFINSLNIVKCRRVHSYLISPLFFVIGIAMGLYGFRLFSWGPDTWAILVNGGLIGGACLSIKLELVFGNYLQQKAS